MSHLRMHRIAKQFVHDVSFPQTSFQSKAFLAHIESYGINMNKRAFHYLPTRNPTSSHSSLLHTKITVTNRISFQQLPLTCDYSSTPVQQNDESNNNHNERLKNLQEQEPNGIIYEGPFASLSKRLKRISITSAIISIVGVPLLITFHSGDVPASGQLAVGSTAVIAATGSTVALNFCFGPYVSTLEYVSPAFGESESDSDTNAEYEHEQNKILVKATTMNLFGMSKETVFDPAVDVSQETSTGKNSYRPFCNFLVRGEPFYIHPNLLDDDKLRIQLVGIEKGTMEKEDDTRDKKKALDDDFI